MEVAPASKGLTNGILRDISFVASRKPSPLLASPLSLCLNVLFGGFPPGRLFAIEDCLSKSHTYHEVGCVAFDKAQMAVICVMPYPVAPVATAAFVNTLPDKGVDLLVTMACGQKNSSL